MTSFLRSVGAPSDGKELEYVAALHQSCIPLTRPNGTVSSVDISRFFRSRFGFVVPHSHALRIVRGLGGSRLNDDKVASIVTASLLAIDHHPIAQTNDDVDNDDDNNDNDNDNDNDTGNDNDNDTGNDDDLRDLRDLRDNDDDLRGRSLTKGWTKGWTKGLTAAEKQKRKLFSQQIKLALHISTNTNTNTNSATTNHHDGNNDGNNAHGSEQHQQQQEEEAVETEEEMMDVPDPEEYLDLVQLLSILLVPTLTRAAFEQRAPPPAVPTAATMDAPPDRFWKRMAWHQRAKKEIAAEAEFQSLRPQPFDLMPDALLFLLQSLEATVPAVPTVPKSRETGGDSETGVGKQQQQQQQQQQQHAAAAADSRFPVLTADLVRQLLEANGEHERARDAVLLDAMVEACQSASGKLDLEAWMTALTGDVQLYEVGCEDRTTTHVYDVWGFETHREMAQVQRAEEEEKEQLRRDNGDSDDDNDNDNDNDDKDRGSKNNESDKEDDINYKIDRKRSQSNIDYVIDSHSSVSLVAAIWLFYICSALLYTALFQSLPGLQSTCEPSFECTLLGTIYVWMTFAVILVLMGFIMILPLSMGNNPSERAPWRNLFVALLTAVYCWVPFGIVEWYEDTQVELPYDGTESIVRESNWNASQWVPQFASILVLILTVKEFVSSLIGVERIRGSELLSTWFSTSNTLGVTNTKKAATRKLNKMLVNAHSLHQGVNKLGTDGKLSSSTERTMLNFVLKGERQERVATFAWTWKMLLTRRLFNTEGVWIMTRLVTSQFVQAILIVIITFGATISIDYLAEEADSATADLQDRDDLPQWIYDLVPNGSQVRGALYPALAVACFVMLLLFMLYIPSYVATCLKYRCGELPSLKSHYFKKYRNNVDTVYTNVGNAIFGLVGSGALFFFIVGLVVFLFIWPFTQEIMTLILAWGIGLTITIVIKVILTKTCRKKFFSAYYRTRPGSANLSTLALECWFVGLGGGVLIGRLTQFLLAACFWVGRIDVPFLSEDVNLVGYAFDYVPTNFVKDLLVHEAHRHPYLERLITMYMMKLKDDKFGNEAGACWRQLFVVALMPWMLKNRVFTEERLQENIGVHARRVQHAAKLKEMEKRTVLKKMEDGVVEMGHALVDEVTEARVDKFEAGPHKI